MNRREFIGTTAFGIIAAHHFRRRSKQTPTRTLGVAPASPSQFLVWVGSRFLRCHDEEKALEALNAIDLGICYIDTAHSYGNGRSEKNASAKSCLLAAKKSSCNQDPGRTPIKHAAKSRAQPQTL